MLLVQPDLRVKLYLKRLFWVVYRSEQNFHPIVFGDDMFISAYFRRKCKMAVVYSDVLITLLWDETAAKLQQLHPRIC